MFDLQQFMELIGWADWFEKYVMSAQDGYCVTFSDLTFGTLPFIMQLLFIIFMLNWIMGMISDTVKLKLGGARF